MPKYTTLIAEFFNQFEKVRPRFPAVITSVPYDDNAHPRGYVVGTIAGNTGQRIIVPWESHLAVGDQLTVQQMGTPGNTSYEAVGVNAALRTVSGVAAFQSDQTFGGINYSAGDIIVGDTSGCNPNIWIDYETGSIYYRSGSTINGTDSANGDRCFGPSDGVHWHYSSASASFSVRNTEATTLAEFAGDTLSMIGWQRWGYPLGPCLEFGPAEDLNGLERWHFRMLGENGVPIFKIVTGTTACPNYVGFRVGAQSASHYLALSGSAISLAGGIQGGNFSGSVFISSCLCMDSAGTIAASDGSYVLDEYGLWFDIDTVATLNSIQWTSAEHYHATLFGEDTVIPYGTILTGARNSAKDTTLYLGMEGEVGSKFTMNLAGGTLHDGFQSTMYGNGISSYYAVDCGSAIMHMTDRNWRSLHSVAGTELVAIRSGSDAYVQMAACNVTWISPTMAVQRGVADAVLSVPNVAVYARAPTDTADYMLWPLTGPIPNTWCGRSVVVTEIMLSYYTDTEAHDFTEVTVRNLDTSDGTTNDVVSYTTHIGEGATGWSTQVVTTSAFTLSSWPYIILIKSSDNANRIGGIRVKWETQPWTSG